MCRSALVGSLTSTELTVLHTAPVAVARPGPGWYLHLPTLGHQLSGPTSMPVYLLTHQYFQLSILKTMFGLVACAANGSLSLWHDDIVLRYQ